ncbi:hypothetical protein BMR1_03g01910 [Babesia microti strain RI]|uniref:Uncharacterized protein n=1 Tax=Babesia microti (strain RI) TaxID=1133968 RepID=A0A0K3ATV1_BABMR|nr:hypothetical protein BMR1_03g01910 [Babesia microti strain RI]CTQ40981.1 hypothetical protein BMR1_03g01910 [Babesia microti strain RI]|eukprot:XP_012648992.1 hypothetical protein BMR1_03g01910 [Babesia microti strain RI]
MTNHIFPLIYFVILFELFISGECGMKCSKKVKISERIGMVKPTNSQNKAIQNGPIPKIVITKPPKEDTTASEFVPCSACKAKELARNKLYTKVKEQDQISQLNLETIDEYDSETSSEAKFFTSKSKDGNSPRLIRYSRTNEFEISPSASSVTNSSISDSVIDLETSTDYKSKSKTKSEAEAKSKEGGHKEQRKKASPKPSSPNVRVNINTKAGHKAKIKKNVIKKKH